MECLRDWGLEVVKSTGPWDSRPKDMAVDERGGGTSLSSRNCRYGLMMGNATWRHCPRWKKDVCLTCLRMSPPAMHGVGVRCCRPKSPQLRSDLLLGLHETVLLHIAQCPRKRLREILDAIADKCTNKAMIDNFGKV